MQDPLGLGANAERLNYFAEAERVHARWAMLAVVGILVQVEPFSGPLSGSSADLLHVGMWVCCHC